MADRQTEEAPKGAGRLPDLFTSELIRHTLVGFSLAVVGLATFWGVHIYGKDFLLRRAWTAIEQRAGLSENATTAEREAVRKEHKVEIKRHELWGMFLVTTGGGIGLVSFGPICEWLGRRRAFLLYHLGGLAMGLLLFATYRTWSEEVLTALLAAFGFWTLGMHAGYAIYFPELFPTRLRGTGGGFCFNFGRAIAAPMLFLSGDRKSTRLNSSHLKLSRMPSSA